MGNKVQYECMEMLSFFDWLTFSRYLGFVHQQRCQKFTAKLQTKLKFLIHKRYACTVEPNVKDIIFNFFSHKLSELQSSVLAYSLDFYLPLFMPDKEKIFYEFEVLFAQLTRLFSPISLDTLDLRARLNNFARMFANTPVSTSESKWRSEHWHIIRSLINNHDLVTQT